MSSYTREEVEAILGPDPMELYRFPKELLIQLGTFPTCWSDLHPNKRVWMTLDDEGAVVCPVCLYESEKRERQRNSACGCGCTCRSKGACGCVGLKMVS